MGLHYGIDLGHRDVKVVAGRRKGPIFELHRAFRIPVALEGDSEEAILSAASQLRAALGKAPGSRFSVSGRDLIIRYTQVPQVPLWRLRRLMEFEIREMSEQAGDRLAADYNLINIPGGDGLDETVLVAVIKEHFLDTRHKSLAAACGEPHGGVPSSIALFNAYLHSGELHEGEYVFLVDIGDQSVEFVLQKDGEILFARNIAAGGRALSEAVSSTFGVSLAQAEEIKASYGNVTPKGKASYSSSKEEKVANALIGPAGQLASMIQSSLAFGRAQTKVRDMEVGRILLSGGGANLKGLDEYLSSTFACPVERFLPESGLDLGPLDAEEAADFEQDPGRFAVALGLALTGANDNAFGLSLLPETAKKKREFVGRTLFMYLTAVAAVLFLVLTYVDLSGEASEKQAQSRRWSRRANKARHERDEYTAETARINDLRAKRGALNRLTQSAWCGLRAQKLIQETCPEGVWIETIDVKRVSVPADATRPKGAKRSKVVVRSRGEIFSRQQQAETALQGMIRDIEQRDPGCRVTIENTSGGAASGSDRLGFEIQLDFFQKSVSAEEAN